jgi:cell division protein FtsI (penicillin-binding protein 3)
VNGGTTPGRHRQALLGRAAAPAHTSDPPGAGDTTPRRRSGGANGGPHLPPARGWFVGEGPRVHGRALWLMLAFAGLALTLLVHLGQVQVGEHEALAAAAARSHEMSFVLPAHRGEILDSSGHPLVSIVPTYDVYLDPALVDVQDRARDAGLIAAALTLSPAAVQKVLAEPTQYAFLARDVGVGVKDRLARLPVPGIILQETDRYVYAPSPVPGQSFAADLLGFVNGEGVGQYGVEGYYNTLLGGRDGQASEIRDSEGNAIFLNRAQRSPAQDGETLELGLDSQVQYWAEAAIADAVTHDQAQFGSILVMDTHTGAIDAWADYPSYNAPDYASTPIGDFRDLSVDGLYEPGSVMKVVTFAGGLQNGAITPGYTFDEQQTVVDGHLIHDWDGRSHGMVSMQTVLDKSLNNGAMKVMDLEGPGAFYANDLAFGIGSPTGVDLAGEASSALRPQSQLTMLDYSEMSFGQSVSVTPVEMLAAVNAVANGGVWVQPHAVASFVDPSTGAATPFVPRTRRVISAQTAATLTTMMTHVVDDPGSEGFNARIAGWAGEVAGKTGTAQEPQGGTYSGTDVSFVGFLPASNPRFTMLVVIDEPQVPPADDFGSMLAAPVWRQMAEQMIDRWHLAP